MLSDITDLIFHKLRTENIRESSKDLYSLHLSMNHEKLFKLCSNPDKEIQTMARAVLITKCGLEEFELEKAHSYISEGMQLLDDLPEENGYIFDCLDFVLEKIIQRVNFSIFLQIAEFVSKVYNYKNDSICFTASNTKIESLLCERAANIADKYDPELMKSTLTLIKTLKDLGFELNMPSSVIINEILNRFEVKLAEDSKLPQIAIDFNPLARLLESFELEADTKYKFDELYCLTKKYNQEESKSNKNDQLIKVELVRVDLKELIYDKTNASFERINHFFKVRIYFGKYRDRDIAIKMHKRLKDTSDMEKVYNEIRVYQLLGNLSSDENCFLKYHGSVITEDRCYLVMDYFDQDLMSYMIVMRDYGLKLNGLQSVLIIRKLIESFAEMEAMHIYHGNINPHNLLINDFYNIKIIGFGMSVEKNEDITSTDTDSEYLLQGTLGYRAPEIEDRLMNGERTGYFKYGLADVFSLGMVLLQLFTLEKIENLNTTDTNQELMNRIKSVKFKWARDLLSKMLIANPKERSSFKKLLVFIQGIDSKILKHH